MIKENKIAKQQVPDAEVAEKKVEGGGQELSPARQRKEMFDQIDADLEVISGQDSGQAGVEHVKQRGEQELKESVEKIEKDLGGALGEESLEMMRSKLVDAPADQAELTNEKRNELLEKRAVLQISKLFEEDERAAEERLGRLKEIMDKNDYKTTLEILKTVKDLYETKGKFLHATNSLAQESIMESGKLSGGLWQEGPSFGNGNSDLALTFNLIWEDLKIKGGLAPEKNPKKINSDKYFNKKEGYLNIFLDKLRTESADEEEFEAEKAELLAHAEKNYHEWWDIYKSEDQFDEEFNDKLYGTLIPQWQAEGVPVTEIDRRRDELIKRSEIFKKQYCEKPAEEELENMYQVTLMIKQEDLPVNQDELSDWQKTFEVRPKGEVDFNKFSTIFVPKDKMEEQREKTPDVEIRPTEELEIIRMLGKV